MNKIKRKVKQVNFSLTNDDLFIFDRLIEKNKTTRTAILRGSINLFYLLEHECQKKILILVEESSPKKGRPKESFNKGKH